MIRQDEYEKEYTKRRQKLYGCEMGALNLLSRLRPAIKWDRCDPNCFQSQIMRRALKDEIASRFARESIHDQVGYDS